MPVIATSVVTNTTAVGASFTPSAAFLLCVTLGEVRLQIQPPGGTDWFDLGEPTEGGVTTIIQRAGTACVITPDVAGSSYRIVPAGVRASAYAWSA